MDLNDDIKKPEKTSTNQNNMPLNTLHDTPNLDGKSVFIRVDFNVPMNKENGEIRDDKRIQHALPTLHYLMKKGASKLILATHIGRPKDNEPHLRADAVAKKLSELINEPVLKIDNWGEQGLPEGKIIMLENLRFNPGEKSKNEDERDTFGRQLASLADIYVNEAFSNSHRAHASMTSIPKFIPGFAGLGVEKEVEAISKTIVNPERPLIAVIGGLKADKLAAIHHLLNIADRILVAGALACNLLKAKGYEIGASKSDDEGMEQLSDLAKAINQSEKVELPIDFIVADAFSEQAHVKEVDAENIEPGWMALDIGPKTIHRFTQEISLAKTLLWFGPIGVFEMKAFAKGTEAIGEAIAKNQGISIIGGGDSASAVKKMGLTDHMTLISTGGGASLEMIEGKELPGLKVLSK